MFRERERVGRREGGRNGGKERGRKGRREGGRDRVASILNQQDF